MPARPPTQPPGTCRQQSAHSTGQDSHPDHADGERMVFYEKIINSMMSGVWVTDKHDTIYYTNQAMETISGLSSTQIIGANLFTSFDPGTVQHITSYYLLAKNTLEPVFYDAVPVVTPAGRSSYQSGMLVPQIHDGGFNGMIATTEDVTRRTILEQEQRRQQQQLEKLVDLRTTALQAINSRLRDQEAKLRRSREFFERVIEGSLDGIVVTRIDGRISMVNQAYCEMHRYVREELLGGHEPLDALAPPGSYETTTGDTITIDEEMIRTEYATLHDTLFATGRCTSYKTFRRRGDGRLFPAEINAGLLYNERQEPTESVCIIRDITERFLHEKHLTATNRDLELRIRERTAELELSRQRLEETNTALQVLLAKRVEDQKNLEENIYINLQELITPCLIKLRQTCTGKRQVNLLDILTTNLNELASPFAKTMRTGCGALSKTESTIAGLIRSGKSTPEIAEFLNISVATLQFHRKNIRKKLELRHTKKNLYSYLQSFD
jgi:PAS domain S-box-containing protein